VKTLLFLFVGLFASCGAVFIAAVTGALFWVWPTSINDRQLAISDQTIELLHGLEKETKFGPDAKTFYPGAPNEAVRATCEARINGVIEVLIRELPKNPRRSVVLIAFKTALPAFDRDDSEERDEALNYLERIMAITGISDSGQLLNVWRYGVPYGWFIRN